MRPRFRRAAGRTGCSASHDRPRIAAKLGEAQARVAAMLLLTLRGTPTSTMATSWAWRGRDPARPGSGPARAARAGHRPGPRSVAHADAVGRERQCRLHHGRSRGCRSMPTGRRAMSPRRRDPVRCCRFIARCWLRRARSCAVDRRLRCCWTRRATLLAYERHAGATDRGAQPSGRRPQRLRALPDWAAIAVRCLTTVGDAAPPDAAGCDRTRA